MTGTRFFSHVENRCRQLKIKIHFLDHDTKTAFLSIKNNYRSLNHGFVFSRLVQIHILISNGILLIQRRVRLNFCGPQCLNYLDYNVR